LGILRTLKAMLPGMADTPASRIKHVFVLMLENRSFDNMLGDATWPVTTTGGTKSSIQSIGNLLAGGQAVSNLDPTTNARVAPTPDAPLFILDSDDGPGHEFEDVVVQLTGVLDNKGRFDSSSHKGYPYPPLADQADDRGFVGSYSQYGSSAPSVAMRYYSHAQVPVIMQLAREFAVCDAWHSSMPGPTWPNRFFVHAATSGGLYRSPPTVAILASESFTGYDFEKGTVYDRLDEAKLAWMVFRGDDFPQSAALKGMYSDGRGAHFHDFEDFSAVMSAPGFNASYVFIEPNYGSQLDHARGGNSQHPVDDVTAGESLIKQVYETLVSVPSVWEQSLLLITWDEHGGFFDHVTPKPATPPGDEPRYSDGPDGFHFNLTGLRVPAVAISPYIKAGTVDHTVYDHSSVPATLRAIFGIGALTARDKAASTFEKLLTLTSPRQDMPRTLCNPAPSTFVKGPVMHGMTPAQFRSDPAYAVPVTQSTVNRVHAAMIRDYQVASSAEWPAIEQTVASITTQGQAFAYLEEADQRWRNS
jgi:phospholipase C